MIRIMKNFSLRLWIITLVASPVCFYVMPMVLTLFPGVHPTVSGGILLLSLGTVVGTSLHFIGRKQIEGRIKEGEIWERAGILSRAEKTYVKAIRTYDSFLLSPFFFKKIGTRLTGTLARFSLTSGIEIPHLKLASAVYLKSSPGDETLAILWLDQLKQHGLAGVMEQEVLTSLANIHYTHKKLVLILAEVLLDLGRMDYSAKRVYKTLLDDPELAPEIKTDFRVKIYGLIGEPERSTTSGETLGNNGKARVVSTVNSMGFKNRFLNLSLFSFLSSFLSLTLALFTTVAKGVQTVVKGIASVLSFCILFWGQVISYVRERERVTFYLRAGAMGLLSVWLLFFMGNTISHILKSRDLKKEPRMIEIQVPKPFTIQVAAYLKQVHADRYVAILNKKGIAAATTKVQGGGKRWYVVRISEFSNKAAAAAFGLKLKEEKIIDDFFVSNK